MVLSFFFKEQDCFFKILSGLTSIHGLRQSPWLSTSPPTSARLPDLVLGGACLGSPHHCDQSLEGCELSWAPVQVLQWMSQLSQVDGDSHEELIKHPHPWTCRDS